MQPFQAPALNGTNITAQAPVPQPSLFPPSEFREEELDAEEIDHEAAFDAAVSIKDGPATGPVAPNSPQPKPGDITVTGVIAGNWTQTIVIPAPPAAPAAPAHGVIKSNSSDGAPQVFGADNSTEAPDRTLDNQDRKARREFKSLHIAFTDSDMAAVINWENELGIPPPPPPPTFGAFVPAPEAPKLPPPPNWNSTTYDDSWLDGPAPVKPPSSHVPNPVPVPVANTTGAVPITVPVMPPAPPTLPPPANVSKHFIPPSMGGDDSATNKTKYQHTWEEDTSEVDEGTCVFNTSTHIILALVYTCIDRSPLFRFA